MKIGLLTFHFSDNYGALLQAFCLQTYLQSLGHTVEFVDYHPFYVEQGGSLAEILRPKASRKYLKKLYLFITYQRQRVASTSSHAAMLQRFRKTHLSISPYLSRTWEQLEHQLYYDHIIVGSDQIWNPSEQHGPDPIYFGQPFSARIPTSSYAASFGSISRIESYSDRVIPWIQSLHQCSVRENEAQDFLRTKCVDCKLTPDPTLLVDSLDRFTVHPPGLESSSIVFAYALRTREGVGDIASRLASELKLQLISASTPWRRWQPIGKEVELDPFTFLGAIAASRLVVSNSFHGVACSVLLQKDFIAVSLPGSKAGLSSRIKSFLTAVGLESRLVSPSDSDSALQVLGQRVDWDAVNRRVKGLRAKGRDFIAKSLSTEEI